MQPETLNNEPEDRQQELIGKLILAWEGIVERQTMHTEGWNMLSPLIYELKQLRQPTKD